jgi:hypothetical protein
MMRLRSWYLYVIASLVIVLAIVLVQRELGELAPAPPVNVQVSASNPVLPPTDLEPSQPVILTPEIGPAPDLDGPTDDLLPNGKFGHQEEGTSIELPLEDPAEVAGLMDPLLDIK